MRLVCRSLCFRPQHLSASCCLLCQGMFSFCSFTEDEAWNRFTSTRNCVTQPRFYRDVAHRNRSPDFGLIASSTELVAFMQVKKAATDKCHAKLWIKVLQRDPCHQSIHGNEVEYAVAATAADGMPNEQSLCSNDNPQLWRCLAQNGTRAKDVLTFCVGKQN